MAEPSSIQTDLVQDFNALSSLASSSKPDGFSRLLDKIVTQSQSDALENNLIAYGAYLILGSGPIAGVDSSEPLGIIAARPLLTQFVAKLADLKQTPDLQINVASTAIRLLQPRVVSFEDQDTSLKLLLADAHQQNEDFTAAAHALETISLSNSQRQIPDSERCDIWVRIARCYLEDDDPTSASTSINRAKNILHKVPTNTPEGKSTHIQFQSAQARVLDSQRQFLDAAASYHALSFEMVIDEDDRLQSLTAAIICTVLAPAGPQRARTLAKLYKDERSVQLPEHAILEKIFLDRVLDPAEVSSFAAKLAPHHLARTSDGSTVLERAVLEHNLLGASRLYRNISVGGLGTLLGTDAEKAEQYAASMIEQGRLKGSIDQIDGMIFFEGDNEAADAGAKAEERAGVQVTGLSGADSELRRWDNAIQGLLAEVEHVTTMIQAKDPAFYAAKMES